MVMDQSGPRRPHQCSNMWRPVRCCSTTSACISACTVSLSVLLPVRSWHLCLSPYVLTIVWRVDGLSLRVSCSVYSLLSKLLKMVSMIE